MTWIERLGAWTLGRVEELGRFGRFLGQTFRPLAGAPYPVGRLARRIHFIGTRSLSLIVLIATFTGAVLALQLYYTMVQFGAESQIGTVVALSMFRELGPVICALMVAGRAGSSLASELGIMRITEQIDALKVMGLSPFRYYMLPIFLASVVAVFLLTAVFNLVGIFGGYVVAAGMLDITWGTYFGAVGDYVSFHDLSTGMVKSLVFGGLIAWVCSYKGYHASQGAEGVGRASTEAVVVSSILILVSDFVMTSLMF